MDITVDDIDMDIACIPNPNNMSQKKLLVSIKNSPRRIAVLTRAFTEALKTVKFCNTYDTTSNYKGKKGFYELTAIINYPFDFPNELFKRNFIRSINNSVMKRVTFTMPTSDKAHCLLKRIEIFFESLGVVTKQYVDKTKVTVQYECKREKHIQYSKALVFIFEKIVKSTDWIIDKKYSMSDAMLVESLIRLTGFTGKYSVETRFNNNLATVTIDSKEEAEKVMKCYNNLKNDYIFKIKDDGVYSFFVWDKNKNLNKFLDVYNGKIYNQTADGEIRWVTSDYQWIEDYKDSVLTPRIIPMYKFMNSIFLNVYEKLATLDTGPRYFKYLNYQSGGEDIEKLLHFIPKGFQPRIYHTPGCFLTAEIYVDHPNDLAKCINQYHKEKNTISVFISTSLNNNFENTIIEKSIHQKFKSCNIKFYPYQWVEGDIQISYVAVIGTCGKATLRRVKKIIDANYESYKNKFLSTVNNKEEVEIFSQESLQDIEASKFPYLCCIDTHYYDIKELGKYIESSEESVLPHNRRPLTAADYQKIANVACDGLQFE